MLPARLDPSELAEIWSLTKTRVLQFVREGKLKRGADGKIDTQEALAFRSVQVATFRGQVLHQTYGNRFQNGDNASPTKAQLAAEAEVMGRDPLAIDDLLAIDDPLELDDPLAIEEQPVEPVFTAPPTSSMAEVLAAGNQLQELRAEKLREEIEHRRTRRLADAGVLISRSDVRKNGQSAGKLVASILRNLPSEIAALFVDPNTKSEVRSKVQGRVDQIQHAIYAALKQAAGEEESDV